MKEKIYCTTLKKYCPIAEDLVKSAQEEMFKGIIDELLSYGFIRSVKAVNRWFIKSIEKPSFSKPCYGKQGAK